MFFFNNFTSHFFETSQKVMIRCNFGFALPLAAGKVRRAAAYCYYIRKPYYYKKVSPEMR